MERDLDFEKRYDYDPSINYEDVLKRSLNYCPRIKRRPWRLCASTGE